ncbi:hypothetical protein GALMADRAFT_1121196 [Galerina marginata CBS 339.88]|uniref:Uncharacterized protein n=1 Tax=Galerina marginata (strain CBS 339.88) TaxID=685588 RepID=A0A067TFD9_GALM3|nr:hypothetical protein GALMADRAFT_1121196 [Galerina marginata CBS 339.88]
MFIQTTFPVNSVYPPSPTSSASMHAVAGLHGPLSSTSAHGEINQLKPCDHCYQLSTPSPHLSLHPCSSVPQNLNKFLRIHWLQDSPNGAAPPLQHDMIRFRAPLPLLSDVGRLRKDLEGTEGPERIRGGP